MNLKIKNAAQNLYVPFFFALFFSACCVSLNDPTHDKIWEGFPDSKSYLYQSKLDIGTEEFWFPGFSYNLVPRPFTVPLLYKLAGSEPQQIIILQKTFHFFSGFILCCALSLFIRKKYLKYLLGPAILLIFCWWNILGWTQQLLSESLSFSFLFIWISSFLFYIRYNRFSYLLVHILITILFSFTRDSWPVVLIVFYSMISLVFYLFHNRKMNHTLMLFLLSIIIFNVQQNSVQKGERHRIPILNNIVVRILGNEKYLEYFTESGMPLSDSLKMELAGIDLRNSDNNVQIYELYYNEKYASLNRWIVEKGRSTYLSFLLMHPSYFFMINEPVNNFQLFYQSNLYHYTGQPLGISNYVNLLFPVFSYIGLLFLTALLVFINLVKKNIVHIVFIILYLTLIVNAVFIYNADSLEVGRHLFFNSVFVEILGVIALAFILDSIEYLHPLKIKNYFRGRKDPLIENY